MYKHIIKSIINNNFFFISSDNNLGIKNKFYGYALNANGIVLGSNNETIIEDKYTAGIFVNIIDEGKQIIIRQDYFCGYGLFIFRNGNFWAISNNILYLIQNLNDKYELRVNYDYLALYITHGQTSASIKETVIADIEELACGEYIVIDKATNQVYVKTMEYDKYSIELDSKKGMDFVDAWYEKYHNIYKLLIDLNYAFYIDLSGGKDSRAAFSLVKSLDLSRSNVTINSIDDGIYTHEEDFNIASMITNYYGFHLNHKQEIAKTCLDNITSLYISLYAKFSFHEAFELNRYYYNSPIFLITGGWGEVFRNYINLDTDRYIKNNFTIPENLGIDFKTPAKNCLLRTIDFIKSNYSENLNDYQKLYNYSRTKNSFMKVALEDLLVNRYTISPFFDPSLIRLNLLGERQHRDTFFALIYERFIPELNNIEFNGKRTLNMSAIISAMGLNYKYKFKKCNTISKFNINSNIKVLCNSDNPFPLPVSNFIRILCSSEYIKKEIITRFSTSFYDFAFEFDSQYNYWGNRYLIRLINIYILFKIVEGYSLDNIIGEILNINCNESD